MIVFDLGPGDPPPGRELAFSIGEQGQVLAWYKPCGGPNGVNEISLTSYREEDSLWRVRSTEFVNVEVFEIGAALPDFETVRQLGAELPRERLVLGLERQKHFSPGEVFEVSKLKPGLWRNLNDYLTRDQFASRDTC